MLVGSMHGGMGEHLCVYVQGKGHAGSKATMYTHKGMPAAVLEVWVDTKGHKLPSPYCQHALPRCHSGGLLVGRG